MAATKAKSMNTNSSYVEFLSLFAEAIDNVGDLNLPIFKQASEYLAIYNRSLKYKSDEVKAKFTNQFVSEQQNLCKGNEKRLRELCKLTPFPFSLTNSNLKSIKELMYSVKVNDNVVFYTETGKGYILDRFNDFYDCDPRVLEKMTILVLTLSLSPLQMKPEGISYIAHIIIAGIILSVFHQQAACCGMAAENPGRKQ